MIMVSLFFSSPFRGCFEALLIFFDICRFSCGFPQSHSVHRCWAGGSIQGSEGYGAPSVANAQKLHCQDMVDWIFLFFPFLIGLFLLTEKSFTDPQGVLDEAIHRVLLHLKHVTSTLTFAHV